MRATFQGFEAARRGILTAQKGLDITGHNLANMYTAGFTRQRVVQESIVTQTASSRYASTSVEASGQGSNITGIGQTRDKFLDKRFREQYGEVGYYQAASGILSDIESALNEKQGGLYEAIVGKNGIITSLQDMTKNADNNTYANIVQVNFQKLTQLLHQFSSQLDEVESQQRYDLQNSVSFVNETVRKIADLNKTIAEDVGITRINGNEYFGPNELLDRRNALIDELSLYGDVEVTDLPNGSTTVKMNGKVVVDHKEFTQMLYNETPAGNVELKWMDTGDAVVLTKGSLKAATDYLNGVGPGKVLNADQTPERGIPYYREKLDTFARNLAYVMNNAITENDDPNVPPNTKKVLIQGYVYDEVAGRYDYKSDLDKITAANISISEDWANDSTYIKPKDTNMDNRELIGLLSKFTGDTKVSFYSDFNANGPAGTNASNIEFNGAIKDFITGYVTDLGTDTEYNSNRAESMAALADDLNNRRGSVADVVEAEETSNMMIYSKAFQASSRLMTALDEALDVVINKMGIVGR